MDKPAIERCTPQLLESYLKSYGWGFQALDHRCWKTGWHGGKRFFPLVVRMTDTWVRFDVKPFLPLDPDWEGWPEMLTYLLEINNDMSMAKFCFDENGYLILSIQVLTMGFSYQNLSDTLGILGYYADEMYEEVLKQMKDYGYSYPFSQYFNI